mmetsp:Transcript_8687/g.19030  ORF Transcript_8687/g.19030 Transcript_8687/m.19030 type:complete len:187 (+) Transcript_8687:76-636(+)
MSRSRSPLAERARLREKIEAFADTHKLDDRAVRIMTNMHPVDVKKVMAHPFPEDVRSPSGFVVSVIRKVEGEAGRPPGYRWDGKSWSEPPRRRASGSRSRSRGGGRSRSRSRGCRRGGRGGSRDRSPSRRGYRGGRGRSPSRGRGRDHGRDHGRDRDYGRDRDGGRDRDRDHGRGRARGRDRSDSR